MLFAPVTFLRPSPYLLPIRVQPPHSVGAEGIRLVTLLDRRYSTADTDFSSDSKSGGIFVWTS